MTEQLDDVQYNNNIGPANPVRKSLGTVLFRVGAIGTTTFVGGAAWAGSFFNPSAVPGKFISSEMDGASEPLAVPFTQAASEIVSVFVANPGIALLGFLGVSAMIASSVVSRLANNAAPSAVGLS